MADTRDSLGDLYAFAQALVRRLLRRHGLTWDLHRVADAVQTLVTAGWEVLQRGGQNGLAKNRMQSRACSLMRDYWSERRHEPQAASDRFLAVGEGDDWEMSAKLSRRGDPSGEAICLELLAKLPERRRQVVLMRRDGYTNREIACTLRISLRTVEGELAQFRKERENDA